MTGAIGTSPRPSNRRAGGRSPQNHYSRARVFAAGAVATVAAGRSFAVCRGFPSGKVCAIGVLARGCGRGWGPVRPLHTRRRRSAIRGRNSESLAQQGCPSRSQGSTIAERVMNDSPLLDSLAVSSTATTSWRRGAKKALRCSVQKFILLPQVPNRFPGYGCGRGISEFHDTVEAGLCE